MTRNFPVAERRRRLVERHFLAGPETTVEDVAGGLVGLHSTDPATVYLSLWARVSGFTVAELDAALYERRTLVRILGMRRTMFVAPLDLAAVIDASCTQTLVANERRRTIQMLESSGVPDAKALVEEACAETLDILRNSEPLAARSLTPRVPALQTRITMARGKKYEATPAISNRILLQLSIEGHVMRAQPLGSWVSSQYRWTTTEKWLGTSLVQVPAAKARSDLVRRWLRTYGPGTVSDLMWWAKWTKRDVVAALSDVGAVQVTVEQGGGGDPVPAWALPDDLDGESVDAWGEPVVSLLPSLDPTIMGWKERRWYLGEHGPALFDRNGNAGPMILVDGAVVGGWGQLGDGRVVTELLEPVGGRVRKRIEAIAGELTGWFKGLRVTPRFPTPLQTRLAGG